MQTVYIILSLVLTVCLCNPPAGNLAVLPGVLGTVPEPRGHCKGAGSLQPHSRVCPGQAPSVDPSGCRGVCLDVNPAAGLVSRLDLTLALL